MSDALSAVVVAAGRSQRMGFDKILTPLAGQPLLQHTIERLQDSPLISEIIVVVRPDTEAQVREVLSQASERGTLRYTHGGAERQDSVRNGLAVVDPACEYVLIHDAARPFVKPRLVERVAQAAYVTGAAVCGAPSADTLKHAEADGVVIHTVDRTTVWAVQTPQIFRKELLERAYDKVVAGGGVVTDDTAAVEQLGEPVQIVHFRGLNVKVTTPADWRMAEAYLMCGEPDTPVGKEIRRLLHDINNHLTPLLGYAFLIGNELPEDSKGKKYAENIAASGDKCHQVAQEIQQIVRKVFPRASEMEQSPSDDE